MRKLNKTVVAGGVVYPAGTAATPEIESAITNPDHWDGEAEEAKSYSDWSKADLEAEVTKRGIEVEGKGNKPDLIAALKADDQN